MRKLIKEKQENEDCDEEELKNHLIEENSEDYQDKNALIRINHNAGKFVPNYSAHEMTIRLNYFKFLLKNYYKNSVTKDKLNNLFKDILINEN